MPTALLSATDVSVRFGDHSVLRDLTFEVDAGEIFALLGLNGAGKTTLVRSICGLVDFTGDIRVRGARPGSPEVGALIGVMPQDTGAWSGIRVGELLRYLASLYAQPLPIPALMNHLQITDISGKTYRRLSGGQRQLVNLAGAMVGRCPLLILDEPTAGMDPHVRRRTWDVIRALRDSGAAVLLTTHDMPEVDALASTVGILHDGAVAHRADAATLRSAGGAETVFMAVTS